MRIKDGFVLEQVGDSYLAVAVGELAEKFNALVRLNETGAFLWRQLVTDKTKEELLEALMNEYEGVSEELAKRDIMSFLNTLKANNILEV